jgi:hypothetical protein
MGMRPRVDPWFPKMLYVVLHLTAPKARAWARGRTWVMLISIIVASLPWQTVAETTSPALSHIPEQAPGSLRRGIVTKISNLRASPSMHSEIVAVAKEGTRVKILLESGRWLSLWCSSSRSRYKAQAKHQRRRRRRTSRKPPLQQPPHQIFWSNLQQ